MTAFRNPKLLKDLSEYDKVCVNSSQLLSLLVMDRNNIDKLIKSIEDAALITDNYPYTEFPLWRWVSSALKSKTASKGAGQ